MCSHEYVNAEKHLFVQTWHCLEKCFDWLQPLEFLWPEVNLHYDWSWYGFPLDGRWHKRTQKMEKLWNVWEGFLCFWEWGVLGSWSKIWVRWLFLLSSLSSLGSIWSKTLSGWPLCIRSDNVYFVSTSFTSFLEKVSYGKENGKGCHRISPLCSFAAWAAFSLGQRSKTYSTNMAQEFNMQLFAQRTEFSRLANYSAALCVETIVV